MSSNTNNMVGSFSLMKKLNTTLILNTIRDNHLISRAEVAKITGLTPATVTNVTNRLLHSNIIFEAKRGKSSGGRKPVMLKIHENAYHVMGAYIGSKSVEFVVTNLNAEIVFYDKQRLEEKEPYKVLDIIKDYVNNWKKNHKKDILGLGVGIHGIVKDGVSVFAPNLKWENINVKQYLEDQSAVKVFVDNDVRVMAFGESWFGVARTCDNFTYIFVGFGIGASAIIDGKIFRGTRQAACEIGHTTIDINGPLCSCGNYGCFQSLASEGAMIEYMASLGKNVSIEEIINGVKQNDPDSLETIEREVTYMGAGISNMINCFNPSMVVINGNICELGKPFMDKLHCEIGRRTMKHLQEDVQIVYSKLGYQGVLKGAVALVLTEIFENPDSITDN